MGPNKFYKIGTWMIFITALLHLMGHLQPKDISSDEKKELLEIISNVQYQLDPLFQRTVLNLFDMFSLSMTVLLLIIFSICFLIGKESLGHRLFAKISLFVSIGMLLLLILSFVYAFSVPIVLFCTCFIFFILSYLTESKKT